MEDKVIYNDGTYLENNNSWHLEDSPWKARQIIKMIEKNHLSPNTVCEIGCGAGEILNQLYQQLPASVSFSGYDISPQAYELARTREKNRLYFYQRDLLEENRQDDILLIIDVIEHVPDLYGFLEKLKSKGVYKIFHIPLDLSVQTVLRSKPIITGRKQVGHIHYFTKETAIASLEDKGYTIIDYFYTAGMVELPGKAMKSKLLNIPRRILYKMHPGLTARILGGYSLMVLAK